jgi:hypothetical protein
LIFVSVKIHEANKIIEKKEENLSKQTQLNQKLIIFSQPVWTYQLSCSVIPFTALVFINITPKKNKKNKKQPTNSNILPKKQQHNLPLTPSAPSAPLTPSLITPIPTLPLHTCPQQHHPSHLLKARKDVQWISKSNSDFRGLPLAGLLVLLQKQ